MTILADPPVVSASLQTVAVRRSDIPALTGLRFLAALSVAVAHAASISLWMADPPETFSAVKHWLESCAGFGMTLFFVLSGFVIHYNYREVIRGSGIRGFVRFLWARFSRLYPLFAVIVVADLVLGGAFYRSMLADPRVELSNILAALPYYLTLTQSWLYTDIGQHSLINAIGTTIPVTWSISTEWFFYLCYPAIMLGIVRATKPRHAIGAAVLFSLAWGAYTYCVAGYADELDRWAAMRFGSVATMESGYEDSFVRWLFNISPYFRIGAFVLGCITAQLYMILEGRGMSRSERTVAPALLAAAAFSVPLVMFLMYVPGGTAWIRRLNNSVGLAPSIALLLFCAARYRPATLRIFSSRPAIRLGEASYSIYLTHLLIFSVFMSAAPLPVPPRIWGVIFLFMRFALMLAVVLLVSTALYAYFEDPARRALRNLANRSGRLIQPGMIAATPFLGAIAACGIGYLIAISEAKSLENLSGIMVRLATYGANCGAAGGNATRNARAVCDGNLDCSYIVDVAKLGDPAPNCGKAFTVEFICAPDRVSRRIDLPGEAGFKSVARLQCPSGEGSTPRG